MNKIGASITAAAFLVGASIIPLKSAFSWSLDFTLINHTDQPIIKLWASPSSDDSWEHPFRNVFVPDYGGSQRMTFNSGASGSTCYYDIRFEFAKGTVRTIDAVYLCGIDTISISVNNEEEIVYASN
jgi:hypothetical protein